jgi:uncharacterized protein YdbL (DUF1318 family)
MHTFNLETKVRRAKSYKKIAKATHEHESVPNIEENHYQWSLNRMTPAQYRSHLLAA